MTLSSCQYCQLGIKFIIFQIVLCRFIEHFVSASVCEAQNIVLQTVNVIAC